jgi:hypothetical protein
MLARHTGEDGRSGVEAKLESSMIESISTTAASAASLPTTAPNALAQNDGAHQEGPLALLDMALAIEAVSPQDGAFENRVKELALAHGADMLFNLPASGLFDGAHAVAALHMPQDGPSAPFFVVLAGDRKSMRLVLPDDSTADLSRFAEACLALNKHF